MYEVKVTKPGVVDRPQEKRLVNVKCENCGEGGISWTMCCTWSIERQCWVGEADYDYQPYCSYCDEEVDIEKFEI